MFLQNKNPFTRTSKFEQLHPSIPLTHSSPYLLGPATSICPKKKYSKNNWYDYKSSNLQLSQKICYRMNAQFHKLQSMELSDVNQYQHGGQCILNSYCKKNPFDKKSLNVQGSQKNRDSTEPWKYYQSSDSNRAFKGPQDINRMANTIANYRQIKSKLQNFNSQKLISNISLFVDNKPSLRMTFGDQKYLPLVQNGPQKQVTSPDKKSSNKQTPDQFLSKLKKTQSYNSFGRNSIINSQTNQQFNLATFKRSWQSKQNQKMQKAQKNPSQFPKKIQYNRDVFHLVELRPPNYNSQNDSPVSLKSKIRF